jgi:F0F1-type ATP synthase, subunit c/Archaeal/vacuolar-type H+-ATPase, subunit K
MHEITQYIHFGTIALTTAINAIGVGIGQGISSSAALEAINRQPTARNDITKTVILGMALIETAAVMGMFISVLLWSNSNHTANVYASLSELGIAFAICISGFTLGIVSSLPVKAACFAVARQPFFSSEITRFMMISLSLLQTPVIFGLVIALFIHNQAPEIETLRDSMRLIGSGLCIGLGSVGPAIGLAYFAQSAVQGLGVNRQAYPKLFSFMLISQAIIETPIIFSLIISVTLLFVIPSLKQENIVDGITLLAAALCTGLGTIGPGISSGATAMTAAKHIAQNPEMHGPLSRVSMFAQGLIETSAIYAVLISFSLLLLR